MAKIAIINARNIFPLDGGDKIFSYNLLKILAQENEISLINIIDEADYDENEKDELLSHGQILPEIIQTQFLPNAYAILKSSLLGIPYLVSRRPGKEKIKRTIQKMLTAFSPEIIVWDQIRSASYFTRFSGAKNYLVEHNDEAAIYRERGDLKNFLAKGFFHFQAGLLDKFTTSIHHEMDKVIYLNKENIKQLVSSKKYSYFPHLFTSFPHAEYVVKNNSTIQLLFIGAMDWYPNALGIQWFMEKVFPLLPENFELDIVGRNASKIFPQINSERIHIHSNVPAVEPFFLSADMFISPIFAGSGINIKILEAASYGIPIVATPYSLRGYNNMEFIPQAEEEKSFAKNLLENSLLNKRMELHEEIKKWHAAYMLAAKTSAQQLFK